MGDDNKKLYILRRNSGEGGAEKAAERLASQLSKHYLVERMWAGNMSDNKVIPGKKGSAWWRSWRYTKFIDALKLRKKNQLILSLEYGPDCDIYRAGDGVHRLNVLRRYGEKKGWMLNPWHWFAPMQEKKCLESAKMIVANSALVEKLIQGEYPHLSHKTMTIYNGFDSNVYQPGIQDKSELRSKLGLPKEKLVLLLSGHGFVRKGLHHAISILDVLVNARGLDACLIVAGKGDKAFVAKQTEAAGLGARINYLGSVTNIQAYYQCADFMVLPTRHDPFSNSCLEALACGCPVITSDQNGAAEVISDQNGFVIPDAFTTEQLSAAAGFIGGFTRTSQQVASTVAHLTQEAEVEAYLKLIGKIFEQENIEDYGNDG